MSDRDLNLRWQTPVTAEWVSPIMEEVQEPISMVPCSCDDCKRVSRLKELKLGLSKIIQNEIIPILNEAADLGALLEFNVLRSPNERKYTGVQVSCTEQH